MGADPVMPLYRPTVANLLKQMDKFLIIFLTFETGRQGGGGMQVELKIDSAYAEPKVVIMAASVTEEVNWILKRLSEEIPQVISGRRDEKIEVLEEEEIVKVYANGGKVFAVTDKGEYVLRLRLYEAEERLDSRRFVRISNSEIINLKKVSCFDLSFTGTICVKLSDHTTAYVSRRYVSKIKKILGLV